MRPRVVLLAAGWLAGAAAAATAVTLALSVLGSGLFGTAGHPLSIAQVEQQLAQADPEPAATGPPQPAGSSAQSEVKNTRGGSVVVWCTSQGAVLMATPAQGYGADDLVHGPVPRASVSFRSGSAEVRVAATCTAGQPRFTVSSEQRGGHDDGSPSPGGPTGQSTVPASPGGDNHGGGGHDHGGGGSNGSPGGSGGTSGTSGGSGGGGSNGGSGGGGSNDG